MHTADGEVVAEIGVQNDAGSLSELPTPLRSPLLSLLLFILCLFGTDAKCIWYGIAVHSEDHPRYGAYEGPGRPLNDTDAFKILSKLCPNYALAPDTPLCCDKEQLQFFQNSSKAAYELLRRCPACWANFRLLFCAMTCDPEQANFLTPTIVENPVSYVESIVYNLTRSVADTFFNSCKDVQFPGGHAIDAICGTTSCTPDLLLKGLGGSQSPFPVEYDIVANGEQAFDQQFYFCNATVPRRHLDSGGSACSCLDCESSCVPPPEPPPPTPIPKIFGFDVWWVAAFFTFLLLVLVFVVVQVVLYFCEKRRRRGELQSGSWPEDKEERRRTQEGPSDDGSPKCLLQLQTKLECWMSRGFSLLGQTVARHPYITLFLSLLISGALCAGLTKFDVTTNPVELWSGPESRSRQEKNYFDQTFAPFYRTEQIIIRPKNQSNFTHAGLYPAADDAIFGPALRKEFLDKVLELQLELKDFEVYSQEFRQNISLTDVCFKPLEPDNLNCAITSPLEYFQSDPVVFNYTMEDWGVVVADYMDHMMFCAHSPVSIGGSFPNTSVSCLGASGMPILPALAFGGFIGTFYNGSTSVVVTFVVNNHPNPRSDFVRKAETWEAEFLKRVEKWAKENEELVEVFYQAERSVEDEINRQSDADVFTVGISYLVMFVYVSIFLASYRSCRTVFVDLRVTLGLGGVLIVIVSVVASVGLWSYAGKPATLIIIEVIPFLVLAVGVDNIFILVHDFEFDELDADKLLRIEALRVSSVRLSRSGVRPNGQPIVGEDVVITSTSEMAPTIKGLVEARMSRTLGRVGPSLLLSSLTESVAFFFGSLTSMPAVRVFALYAGVAILFNLLLQLFAFVALFTLDARRRAANRFDVFCCCGLKDPVETVNRVRNNQADDYPDRLERRVSEVDSVSLDSSALDDVQLTNTDSPNLGEHESHSTPWLYRFIANVLTPFVLSRWIRPIVFVISLAWMCFCIAIIPNGMHLGLDQRLSMPTDSYMLKYFNALSEDLRIGPPLYFVVTEGHVYNRTEGQNKVCGGVGCPQSSLMGKVSDASKMASYSWIAQPASSWIDDYFDWVDPDGSPMCCRVFRNSTNLCPASEPPSKCVTCPVELVDGRPNEADFNHYLPGFLEQNPTMDCPKGGRAPYRVAVPLDARNQTSSTYFMTYHSVLSQPDDFINALRGARRVADEINQDWRANNSDPVDSNTPPRNSVYAYSVFYVFYEQYVTIVNEALIQVGACLLAITVVTFLLLGLNLIATFMVVLGVVFIVLSMLALMVLWHIDLNALSLVNLVVTIGIGVEFCAHIVRAFTVSLEPTRLERARSALTDMGSSVSLVTHPAVLPHLRVSDYRFPS
ncbi:hypothetical protein CRM22_010806 [Opisthorchis felineus]|uniref:SSD domain-containing protein n=2 Tax=Opisthorchis felineus TaxID=147828 RepID=A0A4S2KL66_OPIFE|nr:hypothetical protein CRM22_010806 [Opisthorchis felineus]